MTTAELTLRQTPTGNVAAPARLARKRFDPTQLFALRDRLPWFWFFVAVAVTVLAALDRYHLIGQFKQRERVVIIDPSQTYYLSPLLQFQEAKDVHAQQAEDRKSTRLNSSHSQISYAVFCLKKKQTALGLKMWTDDNNSKFPWNLSVTNGGTMD